MAVGGDHPPGHGVAAPRHSCTHPDLHHVAAATRMAGVPVVDLDAVGVKHPQAAPGELDGLAEGQRDLRGHGGEHGVPGGVGRDQHRVRPGGASADQQRTSGE